MLKSKYFILLCVVLAFSSCAGTPVVFDEYVPIEQSVRLRFTNMEITSFNGIPVPIIERPLHRVGFESTWRSVILPAGEMEFTFYGWWSNPGISEVIARDMSFRYTFPPGEYTVGMDRRDGAWGVLIVRGRPIIATERNFVAFVPFSR